MEQEIYSIHSILFVVVNETSPVLRRLSEGVFRLGKGVTAPLKFLVTIAITRFLRVVVIIP